MPPRPTPGKKWQVDAAWLDSYDRSILAELGMGSPEELAARDQSIAQAATDSALEWAASNGEMALTVDAVERDAVGRITGMKARKEWRQRPRARAAMDVAPDRHAVRRVDHRPPKTHELGADCSCKPIALVDLEAIDRITWLHDDAARVGFTPPQGSNR
jgi:hypothetical protein